MRKRHNHPVWILVNELVFHVIKLKVTLICFQLNICSSVKSLFHFSQSLRLFLEILLLFIELNLFIISPLFLTPCFCPVSGKAVTNEAKHHVPKSNLWLHFKWNFIHNSTLSSSPGERSARVSLQPRPLPHVRKPAQPKLCHGRSHRPVWGLTSRYGNIPFVMCVCVWVSLCVCVEGRNRRR